MATNKITPLIAVVAMIFLGTSAAAAQAAYECLGVVASIITSCGNNLHINPPSISTQCCDALRNAAVDGDVCKCLQELKHHPLMASTTFHSSKAQQLSGTCNLPIISPILKCLVPKTIRIPFPGPPISFRLPPLTGLLPPAPAAAADPPATTKTVITDDEQSSKDIIITLPPIPFTFPPFTGLLPPISRPSPPPTPAAALPAAPPAS